MDGTKMFSGKQLRRRISAMNLDGRGTRAAIVRTWIVSGRRERPQAYEMSGVHDGG
jgi:hypothetical protein